MNIQVILSPEGKKKTTGTTPQAEGGDCAAELEGRLQLARYEDTCARQQEEIKRLRGAVEVSGCIVTRLLG